MMSMRSALIFAGLILAFSLGLTLAVSSDWIGSSTMQRAQGVMAGLVLVIFANLVPKTLEPLSSTQCEPSRKQSLQRFTGWTLVLAGLGYSIAWLTFPIEQARIPAMGIVATGILLVAVRVAWTLMSRERTPPPPSLGL